MRAKILSPTPENIKIAALAIQRNELVAIPTETVYGLAGKSSSPEALTRIFESKERPTFDPLIVHVHAEAKTFAHLEELGLAESAGISSPLIQKIDRILGHFWPGPLTLVLPKHACVPDLVTGGLLTVGVRMPNHPIAQSLIAASQCSLAAPSANRFGRISPTTAQAVAEELGDRIDWILDGGPCQIGVESTVLTFNTQGELKILRPGGTPREALESFVGEPVTFSTPSDRIQGPGMLESHYAPKKPFYLLNQSPAQMTPHEFSKQVNAISGLTPDASIGLLLIQGDAQALAADFSRAIGRPIIARSLSLKGDLHEAAQNLFREMRALDASSAAVIFSELCVEQKGLGFALQDRLRRASARG